MGIEHLNDLFKQCRTEDPNKVHDVVIIDGSNIIFQSLCSQLAKLRKSGAVIQQWQSISLDIITQLSYIVDYAINDIVDTIQKYFDKGANEIIMVVDPSGSPAYTFNTSYRFNHAYEALIDSDLHTGIDVNITLKSAEQEKRKAAANKTQFKEDTIDEILNLADLDEDERQTLSDIFKQSYLFIETKELLVLSNYVLLTVYMKLSNQNYKMIRAIDEADLVIKNIAETYDNDEQILILSMDTDYNVLFGDNPNVDTASLMNRWIVYNPYKCWEELFDGSPSFDFDHIVRLAPLFGNDYTAKESLVNAVNLSDVIMLYENDISELKHGKAQKKITKFAATIRRDDCIADESGLLDLNALDTMLYKWNRNYFKHYFMSNIVYTNWMKYGKHNVVDKPDEYDCTQELENLLRHVYESLNQSQKQTDSLTGGGDSANSPYVIYKWNNQHIFDDWDEFFKTLERIEFNNAEEFIDYYYENAYKEQNDAADFV